MCLRDHGSQLLHHDHDLRSWIWILDLEIWTLRISGSGDLRPWIPESGPSHRSQEGSIDRPQGIGPLNGPFWDPSDGPNPFSQRLNGLHLWPKRGCFPTYTLIGTLVSFSLSRARAKVYIGDPGTGAQDPRSGRSWV